MSLQALTQKATTLAESVSASSSLHKRFLNKANAFWTKHLRHEVHDEQFKEDLEYTIFIGIFPFNKVYIAIDIFFHVQLRLCLVTVVRDVDLSHHAQLHLVN